jgi:hypothetical protein
MWIQFSFSQYCVSLIVILNEENNVSKMIEPKNVRNL